MTYPLPPETLVHDLWALRRFDPLKLRTVDGARLQVVFPGRRNGMEGPDFLDASVHVEGLGLLKGDVEVHVRARDWMSHGHHRDPAYNRVILHLVWHADSLWTERQDGEHVPTAPLKNCLLPTARHTAPLDVDSTTFSGGCRSAASALGSSRLGDFLDEAGDARFAGKAARFQGELAVSPPAEVLYAGIMDALGYSRNRRPFTALARLLPWSAIEQMASPLPEGRRPEAIAAWLLGVAGLLDGAPAPLRDLWRRSLLTREMEPGDWLLAGVRPANHPARRMRGAGELLARFSGEGLLEGFGRALLLAAQHRDPGMLLELASAPPHIGLGRTRDIVVNIVLPFFHALHKGEGPSAQAASLLFALFPPGPANRKVRDMAQQLGIGKGLPVNMTARREQGLIHLIGGACRHGNCAGCPLGRSLGGPSSLAAAS